ncbi:hypothetical protein T439DRAFT_65363 [Meredithblackwellia eburnea MCA 4105]
MNSRDAAYDDAIAMSILGPGSAAMRARFAEGEEATGKDGKDGSGGGGNKGKGKRKGKVEKEEEDEKDDLPTATANTTGASTNNSTTATAFPSRGDRSRRSISRNHSVVIEDEGAGDQSSSSGNGGGKKRKISPPSLSADEISGSRGDETGDRDLVEEVGEKMDVDQPTVPSTSASASTSKSNSVSGGGAGGGRKSGTVTPAVPMGGGGQEEEGEGQGEGMDVDREDLTMDDDGAMEGAEKEENIGTGEEEDGLFPLLSSLPSLNETHSFAMMQEQTQPYRLQRRKHLHCPFLLPPQHLAPNIPTSTLIDPKTVRQHQRPVEQVRRRKPVVVLLEGVVRDQERGLRLRVLFPLGTEMGMAGVNLTMGRVITQR